MTELDAAINGPADFHCIGGFVVSQHYGFARETADLDVLTVIPPEAAERVAELAGKGSPHQRNHAPRVPRYESLLRACRFSSGYRHL